MPTSNKELKSKTKDHVFSLRIKKSLLQEITEAARKAGVSKSDFIRKAVSDEISFQEFNRFSQTMFMGPDVLNYSLQLMDELQIEDYAKLALQNGRNFLSRFLKKQKSSSITKKYLQNKKTVILGLLKYITESILAPSGQGWFERIRFSLRGEQVVITGIHTLGQKFSLFMRYYFIHFFSLFEFIEETRRTILEEDRLKLAFTGTMNDFDIDVLLRV